MVRDSMCGRDDHADVCDGDGAVAVDGDGAVAVESTGPGSKRVTPIPSPNMV